MLDPKSEILTALYNRRTEEAERLAAASPRLTIWEAAALGRVDVIDPLLADDPALVGAFGPDGNVPLGLAAFFGQVAAMERLLVAGADVRATADNFMKVQPLHAAVAAGSGPGVAVLLARGADANARQQVGYTPLMGAASAGRIDLVELLLRHGADAQARNDEGKTATDIAREHGHGAVADRLAAAT